jgi:hypothetical protein
VVEEISLELGKTPDCNSKECVNADIGKKDVVFTEGPPLQILLKKFSYREEVVSIDIQATARALTSPVPTRGVL